MHRLQGRKSAEQETSMLLIFDTGDEDGTFFLNVSSHTEYRR
jgi:hypothetical protein